jgi:hypothetical protein
MKAARIAGPKETVWTLEDKPSCAPVSEDASGRVRAERLMPRRVQVHRYTYSDFHRSARIHGVCLRFFSIYERADSHGAVVPFQPSDGPVSDAQQVLALVVHVDQAGPRLAREEGARGIEDTDNPSTLRHIRSRKKRHRCSCVSVSTELGY